MSDQRRERVTTGVPGLDAVLHGGWLRRCVYLVRGRPGAGKTILANQVCFHHAAQGGRAVYATLLAESHERLLSNLDQLAFFDAACVPEQVAYVSGFATLEESGPKGLLDLLRRETRARRATLLVIDGLAAVEQSAATTREFERFLHEVQAHASLLGCTVLLLGASEPGPTGPEHAIVDGVVELCDQRFGRRAERELEVTKFRGSEYLRGGHAFQIVSAGVVVYPRLEALLRDPSPEDVCRMERVTTGMPTLDRALHGGLRCGSTTVLFGPTGVGKTTLGLHFLNASSPAEPGLHFGFYEPPPRLIEKAATLGLDLDAKQRQGALEVLWQPPTERVLDALGHRLVAAVRERNVKRLFVDGIDGFLKSATHPDRITRFVSALTHDLRVQGVTALYTAELHDLFSTEVALPLQGISGLIENVLLLRYVEQDARLRRMLTVVKTRDSDYDDALRELRISSRGAELGDPLASGMPGSVGGGSSRGKADAVRAALRRLLRRGSGSP